MTISDTSPSSVLLKDAILEAKKLREVATAEATNALVEAVSPLVRKMVEQEISGKTTKAGSGIILEQDELEEPQIPPAEVPPALQASGADPLGGSPGQAGAVPPLDAPLSPPMPSGTDLPGTGGVTVPPAPMPPEAAPVAAPASASVPMPGQDGTITVDLGSLYVQTPPGTDPVVSEPALSTSPLPAEVPASPTATPATPEADLGFPMLEGSSNKELTLFRRAVNETGKLIALLEQAIPEGTKPSSSVVSSLSQKLQALYESNQGLRADSRDKRINDFILENLYKKLSLLESGKNENTYVQKQKEETVNMKKVKTIKEFAASLLEADLKVGSNTPKGSAGFGDGGTVAPKASSTSEADAKSKAMEAGARKNGTKSGKDVEDPEKGGVTTLEESLEDSELAEAFGLGGEESLMEVDDKNVEEGLKESLQKQLLALREQAAKITKKLVSLHESDLDEMGAVVPRPGGSGAKAMEKNKWALQKATTPAEAREKNLAGFPLDAAEKKLLLQKDPTLAKDSPVSLEECGMMDEVENPNEPVKVTVTVTGNADVDVVDDNDSVGELPSGDEDEVELHFGDDDDEDEMDLDASDDEDEMDLDASEDEDEEKETLKENKALRKELLETRLVTARSLYINKVFANHELSKKQKQIVVEYLDKAKTIKEAKAVYAKINSLLEKKAQTSVKFSGSSSRATRPGASLNESADQTQQKTVMDLSATSERWMKLAGIALPKQSGK